MRRLNSFGFTTHEEVGSWYDNKFTEMGGSWFVPAEELDGLLDILQVPYTTEGNSWDLIELGCGDGKLMERALLRGGSVTGVDISEIARDMASKKLSPFNPLMWIVLPNPMENLGLADYDFAISYGSMEHALDIPKAVMEMARILKTGGRWLNYAPNSEWIHEDQPLETTMDPEEWQVLYDAAGLKVETITKNGDNTIYVGYKP